MGQKLIVPLHKGWGVPETEIEMGYEEQGTGVDPGAAGHELQGRDAGAKNREVAPAVAGVMSALKSAEAWFRAAAACPPLPFEVVEGTPAAMALRCAKAIADLEAMLESVPDPGPRPKAPPSPSALFRAGFDYGAMAAIYDQATDEAKEKLGAPPPPDWQAAWAVLRTQLASAGK